MPEPGADDAARAEERPRRRKKHRSWARRRHLGLITTLTALVVLVAGVLLVVLTWDGGRESFDQRIAAAAASASAAATAAPTAAPTASTASPTPTDAATSAAPGTSSTTVRGAITAVGDSSWTVAGNNGLDYTVVVTGDTRFAGRRTFTSFAVGDGIAVKGVLSEGTVTAQTVSPANPSS